MKQKYLKHKKHSKNTVIIYKKLKSYMRRLVANRRAMNPPVLLSAKDNSHSYKC